MKMNKLLKGAMAGAVLSSMLLGGAIGASANTGSVSGIAGGSQFVKTSVYALSATSEVASISNSTDADITVTEGTIPTASTTTKTTGKTDDKTTDKTDGKTPVDKIDWTSKNLSSNDDSVRRAELGKTLGIELDKSDVWEDKKGQFTINPDGTKSEYTSHDEIKKGGFYAVNANRQELIKYAIRTNDWQPYYAFEAKETPLYYEIVDGKYVHTKIYYANDIKNTIFRAGFEITEAYADKNEVLAKEITAKRDKDVKAIYADFVKAPGITPYIVHFNSSTTWAAYWGVEEAPKEFFDSKYNDPSVLPFGKFTVK